jgi:hypothetical protein
MKFLLPLHPELQLGMSTSSKLGSQAAGPMLLILGAIAWLDYHFYHVLCIDEVLCLESLRDTVTASHILEHPGQECCEQQVLQSHEPRDQDDPQDLEQRANQLPNSHAVTPSPTHRIGEDSFDMQVDSPPVNSRCMDHGNSTNDTTIQLNKPNAGVGNWENNERGELA